MPPSPSTTAQTHTIAGSSKRNRNLLDIFCLFTHIEKQTICKNLKKFQDRQTNSPNISSLLLKITLRKYVLSDKVYVLVINVSQDDPTPLIGEVSHFKCEAVGTNLEQRTPTNAFSSAYCFHVSFIQASHYNVKVFLRQARAHLELYRGRQS